MGTSSQEGVPDYIDMKTYFNPTTETVEIEAKWMLCSNNPSDPDNGGVTTDPGDPTAAPGRKVF